MHANLVQGEEEVYDLAVAFWVLDDCRVLQAGQSEVCVRGGMTHENTNDIWMSEELFRFCDHQEEDRNTLESPVCFNLPHCLFHTVCTSRTSNLLESELPLQQDELQQE